MILACYVLKALAHGCKPNAVKAAGVGSHCGRHRTSGGAMLCTAWAAVMENARA
jgi:hypothetical protein